MAEVVLSPKQSGGDIYWVTQLAPVDQTEAMEAAPHFLNAKGYAQLVFGRQLRMQHGLSGPGRVRPIGRGKPEAGSPAKGSGAPELLRKLAQYLPASRLVVNPGPSMALGSRA